jgi:hypothetical protein
MEKEKKQIDYLDNDINIKKINQISKTSNFFSLGILIILFILLTYGIIRFNYLLKEINQLEDTKRSEIIKLEAIKFENKTLEQKKRQLEQELMNTYGLSMDSIKSLSSDKILDRSIAANEAIKLILKNYSPNNNVIISYYNKTIDEKRVAIELSALGYKFAQKQASNHMESKGTNAIWFGSDVPLGDIKIVALALIRAGIPIRGIRPFRNNLTNPSYKNYTIEVGASVDLESKSPLNVKQILSAKVFER